MVAIVVAVLSCASPAWSRGDAETTIVLLDGSGSMIRHAVDDGRRRWDAAKASLVSIAERLPNGSALEVLVFGGEVDGESTRRWSRRWTLDGPDAKRAAIEFLMEPRDLGATGRAWNPEGQGTALFDAMGWALDRVAMACAAGRRVSLIVLSDGDDSDSVRWAPNDPPPPGRRSLCRRIAELRAQCLEGLDYQFWRADRSIVAPCGADSIVEGLTAATLTIEATPLGSTRFESPSTALATLELEVTVPPALTSEPQEPIRLRFLPLDGGPAMRVSPSQIPFRTGRCTVAFEPSIRSIREPFSGQLLFEWSSGRAATRVTTPPPISISFKARESTEIDESLIRPVDGAVLARNRAINFLAPPIDGATAMWDFGDGHSAMGFAVEHSYLAVGPKEVSLRILRPGADPLVVTRSIEIAEVTATIKTSSEAPKVGDEVILEAIVQGPVRELRWFVDGSAVATTEPGELRHRVASSGETAVRLIATSDLGDAEATITLRAEPVTVAEEIEDTSADQDRFVTWPTWAAVRRRPEDRSRFVDGLTYFDLSRLRTMQVMEASGGQTEFSEIVVHFVMGPPALAARTEKNYPKRAFEGQVTTSTVMSTQADAQTLWFNVDAVEVGELVRILAQVGRYTGTTPLADLIAQVGRKAEEVPSYRWFLLEVAIGSRQAGDWVTHAAAASALEAVVRESPGDDPDELIQFAHACHEVGVADLKRWSLTKGFERPNWWRLDFENLAEAWRRVVRLDANKLPRRWVSRTIGELQPLIDEAIESDDEQAQRAAEAWLEAMAVAAYEHQATRLREQARSVRRRRHESDGAAEAAVIAEAEAGEAARRAANEAFVAAGGVLETVDLGAGVVMELVRIEPGRFMMGSPASEPGRFDGEAQHEVTISKEFWLGQTEVTQAQWEAVMGSNPSWWDLDPRMPVERVSWTDADEFCRRLSKRTGMTFRLPTEAEWEYACRAGTTTAYSFGDDPRALKEFGWFWGTEAEPGNADGRPHPVGSLRPNPWGLYDLHGNLREWCADWWAAYPGGSVTDPQGPPSGSNRVWRGGSWGGSSQYCRAASRDYAGPGYGYANVFGFRVARTP